MVASSLFIFSVGFFIYVVSPAYANTEKTNINFERIKEPNGSSVYSDFVVVGGKVYGLKKYNSYNGKEKMDWDLCW
jgi:hypothetical protein